jgi:putative ABC transport system substrate-binding protein
MRRIGLAVVLTLSLFVAPLVTEAQPAGKISRIGIITTETPTQPPGQGPLWERMQQLGWVYGQNVIAEWRASGGQNERVPELAADLMRAGVDVFVVVSAHAAQRVREVTRTLPIVVFAAGDLIEAGLAASLARPGGNVTGVQSFQVDLAAKQLSLLKEAIPRLSQAGLFIHGVPSEAALRSGRSIYGGMLRELEAAAPALRVRLQIAIPRDPQEFEGTFASFQRDGAGAVVVFGSELVAIHRKTLAALALRHRLPAIYQAGAYVTDGGLMSYGPDFREHTRLLAETLDKILRGAKAGDVPIQQSTKFELVINLKTAKALGLTIPQTLLLRADQVIE